MKDAFFVARKDIRYLLKGREAVVWLFVMPILFFYFIGTVTSGFSSSMSGGGKSRLRMIVDAPGGLMESRLERRLDENGFAVETLPDNEGVPDDARQLLVPERFTEGILKGEPQLLKLQRDGSDLSTIYTDFRVNRAAYTVLADLVAAQRMPGGVTPETFEALDAMPRTLQVKAEAAGERLRIPSGFEQAIPGIMVMFTMLVLLTTGTVSLVVERRQGLMRRLASTPISPGSIFAGKLGGRLALALVQIAFAMTAGTLLFGMSWGANLPMILVVLLSWGAFCAALAVVLGNIARTEGQAVGIGVLSSNVLAALGGCWWPIEITPGWMQSLAGALPTGWAMGAMHQLVSFGAGPASALPYVALLATGALILGVAGARIFRFQ